MLIKEIIGLLPTIEIKIWYFSCNFIYNTLLILTENSAKTNNNLINCYFLKINVIENHIELDILLYFNT